MDGFVLCAFSLSAVVSVSWDFLRGFISVRVDLKWSWVVENVSGAIGTRISQLCTLCARSSKHPQELL